MNLSKELKIGIFAITVLLVSFFVINFLRGKDLLNREVEYVSKYENVEGLVVSAPVFVKGYKAGKVMEIKYLPEEATFRVVCSVGKDFVVPVDSKMTIYSVDIMGTKGVRLDSGISSDLAQDGAFLCGNVATDMIAAMAENVGPLLSKVQNTMDSLNVTVSAVNQLLSEQNREKIDRTLSHLEKTMGDLKNIASVINGRSAELESFIVNLSELSKTFNSIASKADTTMTDLSSVVSKLDESDIEGVVCSFKQLLEKMNDPDGSVGKLLVDGSVYDSVDSLLKDVDSLVKKIEENPKKYIKFTIF